ncbi:MAG: SUF system Fe-S cluster assembly regulator [Acidobacteriota bacterium]
MTKQADYGIVLLSIMAVQPERRFAAPELAGETQLPQPTVSKIMKLLARGGVLDSHRGVKGGYSLSTHPDDISVARLIEVLDGPIAFTECIEDSPGECSQEATCHLRGNWQRINRAVRSALEQITLAELAIPMAPPLVQLNVSQEHRATAQPAPLQERA